MRKILIPFWCAALLIALMPTRLTAAPPAQQAVILATTTSTQDSGLLDDLIPVFEKESGYLVKTIAVGSGQAIAMGQRGEADVLLVHSPAAEEALMKEGSGVNRRIVMHNDFVLLGPLEDPAGIAHCTSVSEAMQRIAASKSLFLSRGDQSGTHAMEQKLWKAIGLNPEGQTWYQQTGLGMGQTLSVADEKNGYTLSDRGTFLAFKKKIRLRIVHEGDPSLRNIYHVIELNPTRFPKANLAGGRAFADFMVSKATQKRIKEFGIAIYESPLFFPDAGAPEGATARR